MTHPVLKVKGFVLVPRKWEAKEKEDLFWLVAVLDRQCRGAVHEKRRVLA